MSLFFLFSATPQPGDLCSLPTGNFFAFPTWYKYLQGQLTLSDPSNPQSSLICQNPHISGLSDIWLIVAAVIEILLRVAALVAVIFVIYGGISFVTSEGDPEKTRTARSTIINSLIGLGIAVMAAAIITFIAKKISS